MEEQWRKVVGWEESYEVSNHGGLRTVARLQSMGTHTKFKQSINCSQCIIGGYKRYTLSFNGVRRCIRVHRLVAEAFIQNTESKPFVNHIDGNRINNHVLNLEWCTHAENIQHSYRIGSNVAKRGELSPRATITNKEAIEIHRLCSEGKLLRKDIAKMFNIKTTLIQHIANQKGWNHLNLPAVKSKRKSLMGCQTVEMLNRIWTLCQQGLNYSQISKIVGVHHNTVRDSIRRIQNNNNIINK